MSQLPTEIQTLLENHVKGFNSQNTELFLSVFGETAIIIDGIAPYRWLSPNAPAKWLEDVAKWPSGPWCNARAPIVRDGLP